MNDNTTYLLVMFILFGWIPILAIGSVIKGCIEAKKYNKCTCNKCKEQE